LLDSKQSDGQSHIFKVQVNDATFWLVDMRGYYEAA
jgi:hypothetical protein